MRFRRSVLFLLPIALLVSSIVKASPDSAVCQQNCVTKLLPNTGAEIESVSISGDTAVVGQRIDSSSQLADANVWVRNASGDWEQQANLPNPVPPGTDHVSMYAHSVAIDGDTAIVGDHFGDHQNGVAYVFVRSGTTWSLQATLEASNPVQNDFFGYFVAVRGDNALIATNNNLNWHGTAYVFTRSGTTWSQQQKLVPDPYPADAVFGSGVAIGLERAVVTGAPHSYVFVRNGTHWSQEFRAHTPAGDAGPNVGAIAGRTAVAVNKILYRSTHGWAVQTTIAKGFSGDISGETIAIGRPGGGQVPGKVTLYHRDNGVWGEQANLLPPEDGIFGFGWAVGISGCKIAVGSNSTSGNDAAWVFEPTNCAQ